MEARLARPGDDSLDRAIAAALLDLIDSPPSRQQVDRWCDLEGYEGEASSEDAGDALDFAVSPLAPL